MRKYRGLRPNPSFIKLDVEQGWDVDDAVQGDNPGNRPGAQVQRHRRASKNGAGRTV